MSWQPIETAPKDGTDILAAKFSGSCQAWGYKVISWTDDYGDSYKWISYNNLTDDLFSVDSFSHWMPLPEPPTPV